MMEAAMQGAQGHFDMQLGGAGIQTGDLPITRQPALPTEPQPPCIMNILTWCLHPL